MNKLLLSFCFLFTLTGLLAQSLPIDFDDAADNSFVGNGGSVFNAATNPVDGSDAVAEIIGGTDQWNSRIDLALDTYVDMTTANKTITFEFYTTTATVMTGLFQVGNEEMGGFPIEMQFTTDGAIGWQTITLDFTNADNGYPNCQGCPAPQPVTYGQYAQISVFTNFGDTGTSTYYVDDIAGAANGGSTAQPEPMTPAATPTWPAANVYSFYSEIYTDVPPSLWTQGWGQGTVTDHPIGADNTKEYNNLNFQAVTLSTTVDLAPYTHIHLDVWTPEANAFALKFQDFGPDNIDEFPNVDDSESQVETGATLAGAWTSIDIPLSDFTGSTGFVSASGLTGTANLGQIQFVLGFAAGGTTGTVYIDNLYLYNSVILPVTLDNFSAKANNRHVELNWATSTEQNNDYFEVQRSIDGRDFVTIDKVEGAGNSSELRDYQSTDQAPVNGDNYYRLKQVDYDGRFVYSSTQIVEFKGETTNSTIFPNPTTERFNIAFATETTNASLQIYSLTGQLLLDYKVTEGAVQQSIDLSQLKKGVYQLHIQNAGTSETQSIVLL